jgi:hypothetical protein
MLLIFMASAFSGLADRTRFERETISQGRATEERARIIEG